MAMLNSVQDGFPHEGYPSGWFQVAWVDELAPDEVRPVRYFGTDLVLYRGRSGEFHLLDAFCPHMGAHLGFGGRVRGENIICPYHAWMWGPDGRNVAVPSEGKPNDRCRIRPWATVVANGIVWTWFDAAGRDPFMDPPADLPGVAEGKRHRVYPGCVKSWRNVRMRPQYVPENNVDVEHLRVVHGARGPIETLSISEEAHRLRIVNRIVYGYGKKTTQLTPEGPIDVDVEAELWGLGFQYTFFPIPDEAISIQAQTPVDEDHCDMFQTVLVYCEEGCSPDDEPTGIAAARVREQLVQIERDIPIWENMTYLENAALTEAEARIMLPLRDWAKQFYPG